MIDWNTGGVSVGTHRVLLMGVLNVTPDSFSDGGQFEALPKALQQAEEMLNAGADIIDVGGESTRPGAAPVTASEELARVIPVVEALASRRDVLVSVDTSKAEVMQAAVEAGADMINDVWALRLPGALEAAAAVDVPICLMHMLGDPGTMQDAPVYHAVVDEVAEFLRARVAACEQAGLGRERLIVDPGFGFGKRLEDNLDLLRGMARITALGLPVLAGLSRKSMLGQITGRATHQRLIGSVILAAESARRGASIVRVHDVAETREALQVVGAVIGDKQG